MLGRSLDGRGREGGEGGGSTVYGGGGKRSYLCGKTADRRLYNWDLPHVRAGGTDPCVGWMVAPRASWRWGGGWGVCAINSIALIPHGLFRYPPSSSQMGLFNSASRVVNQISPNLSRDLD